MVPRPPEDNRLRLIYAGQHLSRGGIDIRQRVNKDRVPSHRNRCFSLQLTIEPQGEPRPMGRIDLDSMLQPIEKIAADRDVVGIAGIHERGELHSVGPGVGGSEIAQADAGNLVIPHPVVQIDQTLSPIVVGIAQQPPAVGGSSHREVDEGDESGANPKGFNRQEAKQGIAKIWKQRPGFDRGWVRCGAVDRPDPRDEDNRQGNAGRRYRVPILISPRNITPAPKTAKARKGLRSPAAAAGGAVPRGASLDATAAARSSSIAMGSLHSSATGK